MVWGFIVLIAGVLYGWLMPGRERKLSLFATGALLGAIASVVLSLVGYLTDSNPLGLPADTLGFIVAFAIMTLIFAFGAWVGDLIEGRVVGPRRTA